MAIVPDFKSEAARLALNEACDITEVGPGECTLDHPCTFCQALTKTLEIALNKAYLAGRQSAGALDDLKSPHRAGG